MRGKFVLGSPIITLELGGHKINALLDTGFNGELILPEHIIEELNFKQIGITDYITASGEKYTTKVYIGRINLFGAHKEIIVLLAPSNFSIAGMELFHLCKIVIERHKSKIEIEKTG